MNDVLENILSYKREEVRVRRTQKPFAQLESEARSGGAPRNFFAALQSRSAKDGVALIAEVKKASPSRGVIRVDFNPAKIAAAYELGGAACLSVLTDAPSFQGADSYLKAAREACSLPVLRKDFTIDSYQVIEARALGADAILIILDAVDDFLAKDLLAAAEDFGLGALVEVHDEIELSRAIGISAKLIGINNRNLRTFETKLETTQRLAALAPRDAFIVSESGIFNSLDVQAVCSYGARAILVGESLMRQDNLTEATKTLLEPVG